MKAVLSTLLALCAFQANAQVTYKTTGATVPKVVAVVAKATGQRLSVHKDLANEVVVVSTKTITVDEFKQRLADCVSGKWVKKEDGELELCVDTAISTNRRREAQSAFAKGFADKIKSSREMYSEEGHGAIRQHSVEANMLALDIGARVSETDYAELIPLQRIVFSTTPNRTQRRLPDVSDLIAKHLEPELASSIAEITFAIERPNIDDFARYGMRAFDKAGNSVLFTYISLVGVYKQTPPVLTGAQIQWSSVSQELARLFRTWSYRATSGLLTLSSEARNSLRVPTKIDPMSYGFGEGILACAAENGDNVMASIPDDIVGGSFSFGIKGLTTGEFWRQVRTRSTIVSERADGWITIRPADPISAREQRGDRAALQKLIDQANGKTWPSLDEIADFAASNLNRQRLPTAFLLPYHILINNDCRADKEQESNLRPLQLYACLSPSERQKLKNGDRLSFQTLSPKAKGVIEAIVFSPSGAILSFNLTGEPTEIFPAGIGADLLLSATLTDSVVFARLPDAGEPSMAPAPMSARDVAANRWSKIYEENPYAQEIPEMNRVLVGSREIWTLVLTKSMTQVGTLSLASDSIPPKSKPTTMESISTEIRGQLDQAYQKYLKEMGGG